jgi:hypothetical protein
MKHRIATGDYANEIPELALGATMRPDEHLIKT